MKKILLMVMIMLPLVSALPIFALRSQVPHGYEETNSLLTVSLITPINKANLTTSPILLKARVTSDSTAILGATVKFYADGCSPGGVASNIGSATSDSSGYASIIWTPKYTATWDWYATANKTGYTTGTSVKWIFCYQPSSGNLYKLPAASKNPLNVLNWQNWVLLTASSQNIVTAPGSTVSITISYRIYAPLNPSEIDQMFFIYSWTPKWPPPDGYYYPIYDAIPGTTPQNRSATVTITVPTASGIYYLWYASSAHYSMRQAVDTYTKPLTTPAHIKITVVPLIRSFSVYPNPFSPNGDGTKDSTTIKATFSETISWAIQIRNATGFTVRSWTGSGTSLSQLWDGKNNTGKVVPDGYYSAYLSGRNSLGNPLKTRVIQVKVDTIAPQITSLVASPNPFNPYIGQTTIISYKLSETCTATISIYSSSGNLVRTLMESWEQPPGPNSIAWDGRSDLGDIRPPGTYQIRVYIRDTAGNKATTYPKTVTVNITT